MGGNSQLRCELSLFKAALNGGDYHYIHLLSGQDLLIKPEYKIRKFFSCQHDEFISFYPIEETRYLVIPRIKYYHLFPGGRNNILCRLLRSASYRLQKLLRVDRHKDYDMPMGSNWCSITSLCAKFLCENESHLLKYFDKTTCADELYKQYAIKNSSFYNKVYRDKSGRTSNLRHIDWERGNPYQWNEVDYNELIDSDCLFARKFSDSTPELLKKIKDYTNAQIDT